MGSGTESPGIFDPFKLDAEQWVKAIVSAEMKGLILTCIHHDGFCLWHSRMTEHTVEYSPFKRDIVREVSDACRKYGIKFGVYLSPWYRHSPLYGSFEKIYENTVIGYKRIIRIDNTRTDCLRINITDSRTAPTLAFIGIYKGE